MVGILTDRNTRQWYNVKRCTVMFYSALLALFPVDEMNRFMEYAPGVRAHDANLPKGNQVKLTYLGTGNAFVPKRAWASVLVNDTILLDAGPSALLGLKQLSLNPASIRHIFLSHFHADHFFGLPFLLLEYYFSSPTDEPLAIIGPPGIEERVKQLLTLAYPEVVDRGWPRPITFVEADAGQPQTVNGLTFTAVPVDHVPQFLQAFGYRIQLPDGEVAFSGDTRMTDALYTLIDKAKVCILEATSQDESPVHIGRHDLERLLAHIPGDTLVLLNHLDTPDPEPWYGMNVMVPHDLQTYEFDFPVGDSAAQ